MTNLFFFSVIRKQRILPTVESVEEGSIIPQWGMAVIVIGVGSLLFVVIFGVAVVRYIFIYAKIKQREIRT